MVLFIHSFGRYDVPAVFGDVLHVVSSTSRCCISLFLFLSGYLLATKSWTWTATLRRLLRILVPYSLFSIMAFVYCDLDVLVTPRFVGVFKLFIRFCVCHSFGIYYFVFVISATYLLNFFVVRWRLSPRRVLVFFGALLVIHHLFFSSRVEPVLPARLRFLFENRYVFWPFFFYLGIAKRQEPSLWDNAWRCISSLPIVTVAFVSFAILSHYQILGAPTYDSFPCSLWSLVAIAFFMRFTIEHSVVRFLSETSYFIYLFHILVVYSLRDYWFPLCSPFAPRPVVSMLLSLVIPVAVACLVRRYAGSKVRWLLGTN